jgi:hypothetical protein
MMKRNKPGRHSSKQTIDRGVLDYLLDSPEIGILDEIAPPVPAVKRTIVVVASEDFTLQPVIASVMLEWWLAEGKPQNILLRTHHVRAGHLAADVWSAQDFDFRIETLDEEYEGNSFIELARRLMDPRPEHVFVFTSAEGDQLTPLVEYHAAERVVPTTITRVMHLG